MTNWILGNGGAHKTCFVWFFKVAKCIGIQLVPRNNIMTKRPNKHTKSRHSKIRLDTSKLILYVVGRLVYMQEVFAKMFVSDKQPVGKHAIIFITRLALYI